MAFRKYVRRGLRRVGRVIKKRYFKGKGFMRPNVKQMAADVWKLKSLINTEKKYIETELDAVGVGVTGADVRALTNIAQGTDNGQRTGNSIKLYSYQAEFRVEQQSSAAAKCYGKMWLVAFNETPDTATIAEFLDADSDGNYTDRCFRNNNEFKNFRILTMRKFIVPERMLTGNKTDTRFNMYGKIQLHQRYTSTTAGSISTNQLYLITVISNGTNAASSGQNVSGTIRVNYIDN